MGEERWKAVIAKRAHDFACHIARQVSPYYADTAEELNEWKECVNRMAEGDGMITKTIVLLDRQISITVAHPQCDDATLKSKLKSVLSDVDDIEITARETNDVADLEFTEKWQRCLSLVDLMF